jgi:hypothetical protein
MVVRFFFNGSGGGGDNADGFQVVAEVVMNRAGGQIAPGDALAIKEDVLRS